MPPLRRADTFRILIVPSFSSCTHGLRVAAFFLNELITKAVDVVEPCLEVSQRDVLDSPQLSPVPPGLIEGVNDIFISKQFITSFQGKKAAPLSMILTYHVD